MPQNDAGSCGVSRGIDGGVPFALSAFEPLAAAGGKSRSVRRHRSRRQAFHAAAVEADRSSGRWAVTQLLRAGISPLDWCSVSESDLPALVVVAGPTGSGKSELALRIAGEFTGEIVNCDSLQVYRYLDIGTAKLAIDERRGIPHHLIDLLEPDQVFTAGDYARVARPVLREICARGHLPVVAGGTGFYLRALLEGLFEGPGRDPVLRARLAAHETKRQGSLHRLLSRWDPAAAGRIHRTDVQKLIRALEIVLLTRQPLTSLFAAGRDPLEGFRVLKIALSPPREALYERIDRRTAAMFERGLVEEVRGILSRGFAPEIAPLQSLGYKQALGVVCGIMDQGAAIEEAQRGTRRYAKRQWTWFRREAGTVWIDGFGDEAGVQVTAFTHIRGFLYPNYLLRT